jgi:hypothetical protein
LTGKIDYPMMRYDGYGDGRGHDLRAFIGPTMRMDWAAHRDALLAFWISGEASYKLPNRKGWLLYYGAPGTRPWAGWHLEDHPPRAQGETEAEYLTRHDLWLRGERQQFATVECRSRRPPDEIASRNAQIESPLSGANLKTFTRSELYWF